MTLAPFQCSTFAIWNYWKFSSRKISSISFVLDFFTPFRVSQVVWGAHLRLNKTFFGTLSIERNTFTATKQSTYFACDSAHISPVTQHRHHQLSSNTNLVGMIFLRNVQVPDKLIDWKWSNVGDSEMQRLSAVADPTRHRCNRSGM